jgi:hypothetical protein
MNAPSDHSRRHAANRMRSGELIVLATALKRGQQASIRPLNCDQRPQLKVHRLCSWRIGNGAIDPKQTIEIRCGRWLGRGIFGKMLDIPFGRQHKGVAILSVP